MSKTTIKFDGDCQRDVVEVTDRNTGEVKKFIYDEEKKTMVLVSEGIVVRSQDLQVLYKESCPSHGHIYFCQNFKKEGQTFKYVKKDPPGILVRVQCFCCIFDESKIDKEFHMSSLNLSCDRVDEDTLNYREIRPRFSVYCEHHHQMEVYAGVWPAYNVLYALNFDPSSRKFSHSKCTSCDSQYCEQWFREAHEFGAQDVFFARNHRDKSGNALICMAVEWYDEEKTIGAMSTFCNLHGHIGRYRYDSEHECFELVEPLDVRTIPKKYHFSIEQKKPELMFDDEIVFKYSKMCSTLKETIYFGLHSGKMRKFLFNPNYMQFELVKCADCQFTFFNVASYRGKETVLGRVLSPTMGRRWVTLLRNANGKVEKRLELEEQKTFVTLGRSPVRYLKHLYADGIHKRHNDEEQLYYEQPSLAFDEEHNLYFYLGSSRTIDMQGRIFYHIPGSNFSQVKKPIGLLDSELIPTRLGFSERLQMVVFSAENKSGITLGNFIFDPINQEVRQIHSNPVEFKDEPVARNVLLSTYGDRVSSIHLRTDARGKLTKHFFGPDRQDFVILEGKAVVRTFEWEPEPAHLLPSKSSETAEPSEPQDLALQLNELSVSTETISTRSDSSWCIESARGLSE